MTLEAAVKAWNDSLKKLPNCDRKTQIAVSVLQGLKLLRNPNIVDGDFAKHIGNLNQAKQCFESAGKGIDASTAKEFKNIDAAGAAEKSVAELAAWVVKRIVRVTQIRESMNGRLKNIVKAGQAFVNDPGADTLKVLETTIDVWENAPFRTEDGELQLQGGKVAEHQRIQQDLASLARNILRDQQKVQAKNPEVSNALNDLKTIEKAIQAVEPLKNQMHTGLMTLQTLSNKL